MNGYQILDALSDVRDAYILAAQKRLDAMPRHRAHRALQAVLIAAAILALTFATAMAVSPGFRESVLTLLKISADDAAKHEAGENETVGDGVTVSRVHVEPEYFPGTEIPKNVYARDGLFTICRDEMEYNRGSHYDVFTQSNGEPVRLESHEVHSTFTLDGLTYRFDYEWAGDGINSALAYLREPEGGREDPTFHVIRLTGHSDNMLVWLDRCGEPDENGWSVGEGLYPVVLELATGECTDFAAGLPLEQIGRIDSVWLPHTQNIDKAFFCGGKDTDSAYWYADLAAGKMYDLDALCGVSLSGCCLVDERTAACWALTGGEFDEEAAEAYEKMTAGCAGGVTAEVPSLPETDFGRFSLWRITLDDMQVHPVDSLPATILTNPFAVWWGTEQSCSVGVGAVAMQSFDSTFILLRNEDNSASVLDLRTGEKKRIDGFAFPTARWPDLECQVSPDGEKVLLYDRTDSGYFAVLDFTSGRWINAAVDGLHGTQPRWFDSRCILVQENGTAPSENGEYWFYIYQIGE